MPIFLKVALRCEEPIQLKGGTMYELWKGRKARASCAAYRGILLSDDSSKAYHSDLRRGGDQYLAKYAFEEQFGGIPGRGCDLAVMYMRMMAAYTRQQSLCHSDIIVDAVAAFYSVMRALAIPGGSWPLLAALLAAPSRSWHVLAAFWRSFAVASASWRALAAPLAAFLIALLAALGSGRSWLRCWLRSWLRSWPLRNAHGAFLLRSWRSFAVAGYSWRFLAALLAAFLTTFLAASGGALRFPGGSWLFGSNWRYLFLASC